MVVVRARLVHAGFAKNVAFFFTAASTHPGMVRSVMSDRSALAHSRCACATKKGGAVGVGLGSTFEW